MSAAPPRVVRAAPADATAHVAPEGPVVVAPVAVTFETLAPLPASATAVPDEYLLKLSGMVELANARFHRPDKARWEHALPIAQKLMEGPCDCEQRNWLKHFVAMGDAALTDAEDDYNAEAQLMVTLGRNDRDAMAVSQKLR